MSSFDDPHSGKKPEDRQSSPAPSKPVQTPPGKDPAGISKDPELIPVYDNYGRRFMMSREKWRADILPQLIEQHWNNADKLATTVWESVKHGFLPQALTFAERVHQLEPASARGASTYGQALIQNNRVNDAEALIRLQIEKHGENAILLVELARICVLRKEKEKIEAILWRALELDPNNEFGMNLYKSVHNEKGGASALLASMQRIAALPGSWRAQLWFAKRALRDRQLETALFLYRQSLDRVGKPAPWDLLSKMSEDLVNAGHLLETIQLIEPHYDLRAHGFIVGKNLIKAHFDLGQMDAAGRMVQLLYTLNRADWKADLVQWEREIAKANAECSLPTSQEDSSKIVLITGEGPVWLKSSSPAAELFPAKIPDGLVIAFLGSSADFDDMAGVDHVLRDSVGHFSRVLPLFLAEQVEFHSQAQVLTFLPWSKSETGAFVLYSAARRDETMVNDLGEHPIKSDYLVSTFLKTRTEPWSVELRLIRVIDAKCLDTLEATFVSTKPEEAIPGLASRLFALLADRAEVELRTAPDLYQVPMGTQFSRYLYRLQELHLLQWFCLGDLSPDLFAGERTILDQSLQLCLSNPQNVCVRILFSQALLATKRIRPHVIAEYQDKVARLQQELPLSEPAQSVMQRIFNGVFAAR
jgi:Flp pilus assembly protein TadD